MASQLNRDEILKFLGRADIDPRISAFTALWYNCYESRNGLPLLSEVLALAPDDFLERYYLIERAISPEGHHTFRVREHGARHTEVWQQDFAGKLIEDVFAAHRIDLSRAMFSTALIEGLPSFQQVELSMCGGDEQLTERVLVPVVDDEGSEVLLGIIYWGEELEQDDDALPDSGPDRDSHKPSETGPTESLQIRLEVEGAPISVENFVATEATVDEDKFCMALAPMLRKVRAGLSVNMGRQPEHMLRIIECRLDVQVAASLALLPTENDDSFLKGIAPYLEAFRTGVLRAAEETEATPGERRKWRVRPRYQSFIGHRLQRAALMLGRNMLETLQSNLDVSVPELRIIATLGQDGMQTISDAAEKTLMDRAQVSRTLTKLKKDGLVDKFTDRHDRRISWLTLTEAGEEKWEEIYPVLRRRNDEMIDDLPTDDLRAFLRVLDYLIASVDPAPDSSPSKISFD
jgi:DNA-binding MarR family transcriptional regulator